MLNYRAIRSYDRGRDAEGGEGVKCRNGVAGYMGPGEGLQVQRGGGRGP